MYDSAPMLRTWHLKRPGSEDLHKSESRASLSHCHTDLSGRKTEVDRRARNKLITASILCLLFTVGEAIGGVLAGSLAIATDAAHMLTDFASFLISLLAIYLASRPSTKKLSFGWHRAEIIGALLSVQLIWVVTGILVYMAVERVRTRTYDIEPKIMMITAAVGVFVNIVLGVTLHGVGGHGHSHGGGHSHARSESEDNLIDAEHNHQSSYGAVEGQNKHSHKENINVKAAFIHVIGDLLQSVGVLIASLIIYFKPEYKLADPICTFIFSVFVLFTTFNILWEAIKVLMEATPQHIDLIEMRDSLTEIDGVKYVHNLRIWSLTTNRFAMSVHLAIDDINRNQEILQIASRLIRRRYRIDEPTIQIEQYSADMEDCDHCQTPAGK